jgi:hypothetical protein
MVPPSNVMKWWLDPVLIQDWNAPTLIVALPGIVR